ncbi:MAG: hypothetical protein HY736_19715 [Verrucomicrobia bacterium]|nr:hypothetical protein [Verrucomicrobiota bacterium]
MIEAWVEYPKPSTGGDIYEYRFALSGCAYNAELEGDPFKSSLGGLLLYEPFPLWKVGHSYDDYPQELAAWIKVASITLQGKNIRSAATPHELAADEVAALLTLYLRRLVTVAGCVSVTLPEYYAKAPLRSLMPQPIIQKGREARFWPRLPLTVIYGASAPTFRNPNAEIVGVSPDELRDFILRLAKHPHRERIINAAHLYHRAIECLFTQTDVSYLLLVCAADAIASAETQERPDAQLLQFTAAKNVAKTAHELGLNDDAAKTLALAAVSDPHTRQKSKGQMFREFLGTYGAGHANSPALFNPEILGVFKVENEKEAIEMAWDARGGYVHAANPFKDASLAGTCAGIPHAAFFDIMIGNKTAPSILWLERLIAHSIQVYLKDAKAAWKQAKGHVTDLTRADGHSRSLNFGGDRRGEGHRGGRSDDERVGRLLPRERRAARPQLGA